MYENGGNYVSAPIYNDVAAYSTYANSTVPSGATVINGAYFRWDRSGFTGHGWFRQVEGGPLSGFASDEAVLAYIDGEGQGTLNGIFSSWNPTYDQFMDFADNFREGEIAAGCADFDISVQE